MHLEGLAENSDIIPHFFSNFIFLISFFLILFSLPSNKLYRNILLRPGNNIITFDRVCVERNKNSVPSPYKHFATCQLTVFSRTPGLGIKKLPKLWFYHNQGKTPYTVTALHLRCHWRHGKLHSQPGNPMKRPAIKRQNTTWSGKKSKGSDRKSTNEDMPLSLNVWYMQQVEKNVFLLGHCNWTRPNHVSAIHGQFLRNDCFMQNPKYTAMGGMGVELKPALE